MNNYFYDDTTYNKLPKTVSDYINTHSTDFKNVLNLAFLVDVIPSDDKKGTIAPYLTRGEFIRPEPMTDILYENSMPLFEGNPMQSLENVPFNDMTEIRNPETERSIFNYSLIPFKTSFQLSKELQQASGLDYKKLIAKKILNSYLLTTHTLILDKLRWGNYVESQIDLMGNYDGFYDTLDYQTRECLTDNTIIMMTGDLMEGLIKVQTTRASSGGYGSSFEPLITFNDNSRTGVKVRNIDIYVVKDFGSFKPVNMSTSAKYKCVMFRIGDFISTVNYTFKRETENEMATTLDKLDLVEERNIDLYTAIHKYGKYINLEHRDNVNRYGDEYIFSYFQQIVVDYTSPNFFFKGYIM